MTVAKAMDESTPKDVKRQCEVLNEKWTLLLNQTKARHARLQMATKLNDDMHTALDGADANTRTCTDKLREIEEQLATCASLPRAQDTVTSSDALMHAMKQGDFDAAQASSCGDKLIAATAVDHRHVTQVLNEQKQSRAQLRTGVDAAQKGAEQLSRQWTTYQRAADDADKSISKIEEHAKSTNTANKGLHVYGKLKTLLEETQGPVQAKVVTAAKECDALGKLGIDKAADKANHDQVDQLKERAGDCVNVLNDKLGSLDAVDQSVQSLHEQMRQLSRVVKQFDGEFDTMEPLARDVDYLHSQQRSLVEFDERLARVADDIGQHKTTMDNLLDALNADQVNALRGQYEHLEEDAASVKRKSARRADQIRTAIDDLTALLHALRDAHEQVLAKLDHPVIRDTQQATFTHVRQIRDQQEALRRFRTELEPLGERVQTLLVKGRDGQRQAAPGVNTAALETATNAVTDSWAELQSRVNFKFV